MVAVACCLDRAVLELRVAKLRDGLMEFWRDKKVALVAGGWWLVAIENASLVELER
jgi:hypothetical protein